MNRPAFPTADGVTLRPYHYWTGASGRPYVHTVFAPGEAPHFAGAAILLVANRRGRRVVIDVAATGPLPALVFHGRALREALARGANEIHMHLAGPCEDARTIAADLAAANRARPLRAARRALAEGSAA